MLKASIAESSFVPGHPRLGLLARRLRALREKAGLTQDEFARQSALSVSFVSLLERGERSPSYETLCVLAETLRVEPSALLVASEAGINDDPYYLRLGDFARERKLSRSQVDQWIAVGKAMFESASIESTQSPTQKCTFAGCDRSVLARGLCATHYHRRRRATAPARG